MKRLLLVAFVLPVLATPAAAIDVTWNNCVLAAPSEPQPQATLDFDCESPHSYVVYGSFKVQQAFPDFLGADLSFDFSLREPGALPPFWHLEAGGCNRSGIDLIADKSRFGTCSLLQTPWGESGEYATVASLLYGPDFASQPGRGRLLASIARTSGPPLTLQPGTNYYLFSMVLNTVNASTCEGCTQTMIVMPLAAVLFSQTASAVVLSGPEKQELWCVAINTTFPLCFVDAVRPATWGTIKTLYR
jgi:hypothetical protein